MSTSRMPITTFVRLFCLSLFLAIANCQTSTTLVTATTTVTSSATDNGGACNNFEGACVVYGGPQGAYTTTVYAASSPRPTVVTATTTTTVTYIPAEQATTGAVSACQKYSGACIVYGTDSQGSAQYTTTVYAGASSSGQNNGNDGGDGLIGGSNGNGDGYIGPSGAASLSTPVALSLASLLIVNLGFLVWM